MATINLLPWREEQREEQKKEFLTICGVSVLAAILVVVAYYSVVDKAVTDQQSRNDFVQRHITDLDDQVKEIKELKAKRKLMLDRMKVVQDLQGTRPYIVHLFDELVGAIPDGLFLTQVESTSGVISLTGTAESSQRVSSLMRALEASDWFKGPNLTEVNANRAFGEQGNDFKMTVKLEVPGQSDPEGES
ncbi:hypothetical protein SIN8267_01989 [Sinobacterium norvegicum]|uniref:Pilus assembly protein PilN n=1 Tax=Sinobacterium norvegicum TaxID=1641715 RepID=A0ABM9AF99_9GAMM|nr:PilN domain-containing protein [Sinobacterium norvegicum]CAH0991874.1 hypothetical protein SIN8267_01989 [Sinobacterium norvegicum]